MEIIQTKKVHEASKQAALIDVERILAVRQPNYSDFYLKNLEMGAAGEEKVLEFLKLYGNKDWKVIRNIWLNDYGKFECDLLLITRSGIYLFEIKHYNGYFEYKNGDCILNNKILPDHPITQTQRNFRKLKKILRKLNPHLKIFGALVFIGEHNSVDIHSPISDIKVVRLTEFKDYILKIVEADSYHMQNLDTSRLITHLEKYEDENSFVPEPLDSASVQKLRKGIYCDQCQNFQVSISKLYIHCHCGFKESREKGTLRTICEYSVLTKKDTITQGEALAFINNQSSGKYLTNLMSKHFKRIEKGRYTSYAIDPVPFERNKTIT